MIMLMGLFDFNLTDVLAVIISFVSLYYAISSINGTKDNNRKIQEYNRKVQDLQKHREESKLVPKVKELKIKRNENDPTLGIEITNVGNYSARNLTFKIEKSDIALCSDVEKKNNPIEIAPGGNYFFYTTIPLEYLSKNTYHVILSWEDEHGRKWNITDVEVPYHYKKAS